MRLFAKGNVDVHDSLHSCRIGGDLVWNGINAALREGAFDVTVRVRHETWTRSDALLAGGGTVPELLASRDLALGVHGLQTQFSRAVFDAPSEVVVLSIQPDILSGLLRHRETGVLLYPNGLDDWATEDRSWIRSAFEPMPPLDAAESIANFRAIVAALQQSRLRPILIYNMSSLIPGETLYCYEGMDEALSERIKRFNLSLVDLSRETGIHIVDVDRIVAEHGGQALKRDPVHLTERGYRLVAHEVVRVLADCGAFEDAA